MAYKGKWYPKNPEKYEGDLDKIVYRSLWERQTFKWCDQNSDIKSWSSESIVVPYISKIDGRRHRYFVDLKITFSSGKTYLVEIKPEKQTKAPDKQQKRTRRYLKEVMTYGTNISKWEYAQEYAKDRGWEFVIWTEKILEELGIKILKSDKYTYGSRKKKQSTSNRIRANSRKRK